MLSGLWRWLCGARAGAERAEAGRDPAPSRRSRVKRRRGPETAVPDDEPFDPEAPVSIPLDGRLDLHLFSPKDVKALLAEYLPECRRAGVLTVEVIHGKGTGALRRTVHTLLARMPEVASFSTADESRGGWGVTVVTLKPTD